MQKKLHVVCGVNRNNVEDKNALIYWDKYISKYNEQHLSIQL